MNRSLLIQIGIAVAGIFLMTTVLLVSVRAQRIYTPNEREKSLRAGSTARTRFTELLHWPPEPDHPLYIFRMIGDRVRLLRTDPTSVADLQLDYARERLTSAKRLLDRGYVSLALSTVSKSTLYVAAAATPKEGVSLSNETRSRIAQSLHTQKEQLLLIKPRFFDEQKPVIDRLIAELSLLEQHYRL